MEINRLLSVIVLTWCFQTICSSPSHSKTARIVGGSAAHPAQFSFAAALYIQVGSSGSHFCGGALISNQWILTAAHCLDGATQLTIRLGSNSLSDNDPNRVTVSTAHYVVHPNFQPATLEHDIALIRLRIPIEFTSYIQPIELATNDTAVYAHMTAIGWGQTDDSTAALADHLQFVSLITISNQECMNVFGLQVASNMVCATGNLIEGTCFGDTGGPLIEHTYFPQTVKHAGISSFISGNGCEAPHPSGYTRTYRYIDWINNVIATDT